MLSKDILGGKNTNLGVAAYVTVHVVNWWLLKMVFVEFLGGGAELPPKSLDVAANGAVQSTMWTEFWPGL